MSNIIDSIQLSGTVYTLSAQTSGGGNPTIELTQAQYDALVTAGTVSADTYYIITDASAGDLTQYWTSAQTQSAITQAVSGKQDTLVSGTNIKTINNESLLGSGNIDIQGGGKAIEAGRGITVTTGETADTVSFNLPISAGTGSNSVVEGSTSNRASGSYSHAEGNNTIASGDSSHAEGRWTKANGSHGSHAEGYYAIASGTSSHAEGQWTRANGDYSHAEGYNTKAENSYEHASGQYNVSSNANNTFGDSGNTLFSVGNGTSNSARHNAFEVRQNGDIYLNDGTNDVKLQDYLQIKAVQITQSAYDQLQTKDPNTLYCIVN